MQLSSLLLLLGLAGVALGDAGAEAGAKPKADATADATADAESNADSEAEADANSAADGDAESRSPARHFVPQQSYQAYPPSLPPYAPRQDYPVYPSAYSTYPWHVAPVAPVAPSYPALYPSYPQQPSYYDYEPDEKCTTKEWSSVTELCKPKIRQNCENLDVRVKKVRDPKTTCIPHRIPKCKVESVVKEMRMCNTKVLNKRVTLHATLFEQQMVVRCNTHYETECDYRYYKPRCYSKPTKNCYDLPHLTKVQMPIRVSVAETKEDCLTQHIPTPKTICWEEEKMLCPSIPELIEKERTLLKCSLVLSNDDCQQVKLTIPKEICYPVEKYYPYPQPAPLPYPPTTTQ